MILNYSNLIAFIAAFLTTVSFLPQAIKTIQTKETKGISLSMYTLFTIGVIFWIVFGWSIQNYIMVVGNGITAILAGIVLMIKIQNYKKDHNDWFDF